MKIYMLWVQRKCSYPNQYAPELYASVDEYTDEDNPDYMNGKRDEVVKYIADYDSFGLFEMEINLQEIVDGLGVKTLLAGKSFLVDTELGSNDG